ARVVLARAARRPDRQAVGGAGRPVGEPACRRVSSDGWDRGRIHPSISRWRRRNEEHGSHSPQRPVIREGGPGMSTAGTLAPLVDRFRGVRLDGLCSLEDRYRLFAPRAIREHAITHPRARLAAAAWGQFVDLAPPDVAGPVLAILDKPALLAGQLARCTDQTL